MLKGLDSAFAPSLASARQAYAAGVRVWGGYFSGPGIYNGWTDEEIRRVQSAGHKVIVYCSGWSDPVQVKAHAHTLNVQACLDVESGIRGDGPWVQPWLDASDAGLYGNGMVHGGRRAAFHELAGYPGGDVAPATWHDAYGRRPAGPCGWQYRGSHTEFGLTVDSAYWDDWFGGGNDEMTSAEMDAILEGARERRDGQPQPDQSAHPLRYLGWSLANCGAVAGQALVDAEPKPTPGGLAPHNHTLAASPTTTGGVA